METSVNKLERSYWEVFGISSLCILLWYLRPQTVTTGGPVLFAIFMACSLCGAIAAYAYRKDKSGTASEPTTALRNSGLKVLKALERFFVTSYLAAVPALGFVFVTLYFFYILFLHAKAMPTEHAILIGSGLLVPTWAISLRILYQLRRSIQASWKHIWDDRHRYTVVRTFKLFGLPLIKIVLAVTPIGVFLVGCILLLTGNPLPPSWLLGISLLITAYLLKDRLTILKRKIHTPCGPVPLSKVVFASSKEAEAIEDEAVARVRQGLDEFYDLWQRYSTVFVRLLILGGLRRYLKKKMSEPEDFMYPAFLAKAKEYYPPEFTNEF